jgi:uncharacterized protein (TIGR02996 family)
MTDDSAFLQAIAEAPDDLGPRLRYADFLDEQGDAAGTRAEFIRVQCALDQLPPSDSSFDSLRQRERQLLETNWHVWMRPICQAVNEPLPVPPVKRTWTDWWRRRLRRAGQEAALKPRFDLLWTTGPRPNHIITRPPAAHVDATDFLGYARFVRGLVGELALHHRDSRGPAHLDRLFERAPVSHLSLHGFDDSRMRHLIQKRWLGRLRRLELQYPLADVVNLLLTANDAGKIRSLSLFYVTGQSIDLACLRDRGIVLQPEQLGLHHLYFAEELIAELAASPFMARVRHLMLEGIDLGIEALLRLLERNPIERLEFVGLVGLAIEQQTGDALRARFPQVSITSRGHRLA